jgi:DNA uptake protein ComE-like DNA-binding protein
MWKDFFNFTKRERITILTLTVLIILVQILIWTKDFWVKFLPITMEQKYLQKKELEAFRDSVTANKPTYASRQRSDEKNAKNGPLKLVPFNPNTADSLTLRGLGLRSYVVNNILNYRRKGGQFRKPSDFARIYGLEPAVFATLEPLIQLEASRDLSKSMDEQKSAIVGEVRPVDPTVSQKTVVASGQSVPPVASTVTFDLNSADTTLLLQLKGVGSFTANRIARYRNELGGFYSLSQLAEVKGLYPETLARLQTMLRIDPAHINTLNVNKASLEKLRAHPYLTFYQAKVIVELRKSRGKIHSIDALKDFKEFTTEDLERLKWYLDFS